MMLSGKCPKYTGQGAQVGNATCSYFTKLDARLGSGGRIIALIVIAVLIFLILRWLERGRRQRT